MNLITINDVLDLPRYYLAFSPDTELEAMKAKIWWDVEDVYLFVAPTTPQFKFLALPIPEVNDASEVAERLRSRGRIGSARQAQRGRSKSEPADAAIQRDSDDEKERIEPVRDGNQRNTIHEPGRRNVSRRKNKRGKLSELAESPGGNGKQGNRRRKATKAS